MTAVRNEQVRDLLATHEDELRDRFSVKRLGVFGSVARGEAEESSDVDLLVEFEPDAQIGLFEFVRLQSRLSQLVGCKVDLVTVEALHDALKERVLGETVYVS